MDIYLENMKILIIGYGSIAKRHFLIIKKNFKFAKLYILSRRKIKADNAIILKSREEIKKIKPDYVIIASETNKHYSDLIFLEKNLKNINILVEKPLFHKKKKINVKKNNIYVGYNLRFHPGVLFLRKLLIKNNPIDIKIITNSYLPNWRNDKYSSSYSANKKKGGGVILDLSHEVDLALWLFGEIKISFVRFGKQSNLKISSEDNLKLFGKIKNANFYLDLSYYSKNEIRNIYIDTNKNSLFLDLKNNLIKINNTKKNFFPDDINQSYLNMHEAIILKKNAKYLCKIDQGRKVLDVITRIKKFKLKEVVK